MATLASRASRSFTLEDVRARATKLYTLIAWIHVPAAIAIALNSHNAWLIPTLILAIGAVVLTVSARVLPSGLTLRTIAAVVLTLAPIVFVFAGRGEHSGIAGNGDWQIDYHMYFFAVFAMLVGYVDWRPIAISAALTAVIICSSTWSTRGRLSRRGPGSRVSTCGLCVVAEVQRADLDHHHRAVALHAHRRPDGFHHASDRRSDRRSR